MYGADVRKYGIGYTGRLSSSEGSAIRGVMDVIVEVKTSIGIDSGLGCYRVVV
jgi:hypothetical protein